MAKVLITGSSDGLGLLAAQRLFAAGHTVVLHARNAERAEATKAQLLGAQAVLIADFADREAVQRFAEAANAEGPFDAVIHNAGVYRAEPSTIAAVNVMAPYLLTALIARPKRLIYLGSNMHFQGSSAMNQQTLERGVSYSDSKLLVLMLAKAAARRWPECCVNTVDPGWVPTKMGGSGAPDSLEEGARTQVWLASHEEAIFSGRYLFHMKEAAYDKRADDTDAQEQLLQACQRMSGVALEMS